MITTENVRQQVEQLSEALVLIEASDLQELARVHEVFEGIGGWADSDGKPEIAAVAKHAATLAERIILGDTADSDAACAELSQCMVFLQATICNGRPPAEMELPPGMTSTGEQAAPEASAEPDQTSTEDEEEDTEPLPLEGDLDLLVDFVQEANEHLDAADVHLLTLETTPTDEDALNAVFRAFHTIKGVAGFLALDDILKLAHEAENLLDNARKGSLALAGGAIDVTFEAVDMLKQLVAHVSTALESGGLLNRVENLMGLVGKIRRVLAGDMPETPAAAAIPEPQYEEPPEPETKLGGILVEMGSVSSEVIDEALREQQDADEHSKLGEVLVKTHKAAAKDVAHALRNQQACTTTAQVKEAVRVDALRLDNLIDHIGELVIAETMVTESPEIRKIVNQDLMRRLSQLDKITRELQEIGMSLRMVPVRALFQKMARLARDLSKKSGKQVDFVMSGEETELDKSVVDKIGDPLVHMIRNSVDHGIESDAEARTQAGKPVAGRVELRAFHKGGSIHIEIEDDGRGLDRAAILSKAIERGLVRENDNLTDREVWNLVFEPGFSTAKKVTDVSGRGVGMDVVMRNIEALRGQVDIHSEGGKGSIFSIRLPLTLAIIDGMVVRVGNERYILPTLSIVTSLRPQAEELISVLEQGEMLMLQGTLIPVFRLGELFKLDQAGRDVTKAIVVVVEAEGRRSGLVVDEILGQQQIVIKSLGESMQGIPGIAGGAVMGDGKVGLILDISGLVKLVGETELKRKVPPTVNTEPMDKEQEEAVE